jgi:hypothetical protein
VKLLSDCLANETSFRPETSLFIALEPLLDGSVVDCLLRIAFNDDLGVSPPRAIRNGAPLASLFHIYRQNDAELTTFLEFVSQCFEAETSSQYELVSTDFPGQLIHYLAGFREKAETTPVFQKVLNFFVNISRYSLKSKDLLAFFQLFSTVPGNFRPQFTWQLLDALTQIMEHVEKGPTAFFTLDGEIGGLALPRIPSDLLSEGFCLVIVFELLSFPRDRGFLFDFRGQQESFSLLFGNDASIFLGPLRVQCEFVLRKWTKIIVSYNRKVLTLFVDDKEVLSDSERRVFKEDCTKNTLGKCLHCNIAGVELFRKPRDQASEKSIFFRFDASTVYESFAIFHELVAQVTAKTFYMSEPPIRVLNHIGGVSTLLPLFAQLEQPTQTGAGDSSGLLLRSLRVLRAVFRRSESHQRDFESMEGFQMLAVLLSIASGRRPFTQDCIDGLTELYASITHLPLAIRMIEHVLFNVQLWSSHSLEFQTYFFNELFKVFHRTILANPRDEALRTALGVTRILYHIRCFLCDTDDRSLQVLRDIFWGFAVFVSDMFLSDEDVVTVICFSRTPSLAQEGLKFFLELLKRGNSMFISHLQRIEFEFSELLPLLNSTDYRIVLGLLDVFTHLISVSLIGRYTSDELLTTMLLLCDPRLVCLEMAQQLAQSIFPCGDIIEHTIIPFFLFSLLYIDASHAARLLGPFARAMQGCRSVFPQYQNYFILWLLHLHFNLGDDPFTQTCMRTVAALVLLKPVVEPLQSFVSFCEVVAVKLNLAISSFLRSFFIELLNLPPPDDKMNSVYMAVFNFLFRIPAFDPFFRVPFDPIVDSIPKADFRSLLGVLYIGDPAPITYEYGSRTTMDGRWVDADLAYLLVDTGRTYPILPATPFHPLDIMGFIVNTGLAHFKHTEQFIGLVEPVLELIPPAVALSPEYKRAIFLVIGGMLRGLSSTTPHALLAKLLFHGVHGYQDLIATELRCSSPVLGSIEEFTDCFKYRVGVDLESHFKCGSRARLWDRALRIEQAIASQLAGRHMEEFPVLTQSSQIAADSWVIQQNELAIEQFTTAKREMNMTAVRRYRTLFQSLSSDNGPWSTPELVPKRHFKLDNLVFKRFVRYRMKPNIEFKDHRAASLARDLGSFDNAREIYQKELSRIKMQEFKGDFALLNLAEDDGKDLEIVNLTDVRMKCDAQLITPQKVHSGHISLTKKDIFFDSKQRVIRIPLSWVSKIYFRRYLLVDSAIEIFTTKCKAYFINFDHDNRQTFLAQLLLQRLPSLKFCQRRPDDVKRLTEQASVKWRQGKLSNFSYLMKLNNYSGRSYNDLSQYPVMPWVIADYHSEILDLSNPKTYRDLRCPVGALNEERLSLMKARLGDTFEDDSRYLYGSLYSSAAVVIGYLIRLEPFTTLHVTLQSGRFDHSDRLFFSIADAWESVQTVQMDFRELIPEFFTLPSFLLNADGFDLGTLSDGRFVNDVVLPPWAQNAREFVELNRQALESEFVTTRLHAWVDLIFGPSARAPHFEAANNIFHPFFYETALTPDVMEDPLRYSVVREYAACFGTVPARLFDDFPMARDVRPGAFPTRPTCQQLMAGDRPILALTCDRGALIIVDDGLRYTILSTGGDTIRGRLLLPTPPELQSQVRPRVAVSRRFAIAALPWSASVSVFGLKGAISPAIFHCAEHSRAVAGLALCGRAIISGARDGTLRLAKVRRGDARARDVQFLAKHGKPIVIVRANERLREAIAVYADGFLIAMSLFDGRYIVGIKLPLASPTDLIVSDMGFVAICYNGPDSHTIVVVDQNLEQVALQTYDGCVQCWATLQYEGLEFLVIGLKGSRVLALLRLPCIGEPIWHTEVPFAPAMIACSKNEWGCFLAGHDGTVIGFRFAR